MILQIDSLKRFLHDQFKIKDLGRLHYFLGLEILYKYDGVLISQRKFALDILKEFDCLYCPCSSSPLDPTVNEPHLHAAFHLLRCIKRDSTLEIFMSNSHDCTVRAFSDSDWAACPNSGDQFQGILFCLETLQSVGSPRNKRQYHHLQLRQSTSL
uniref:Reverse transcriptase Ty1/copia-type domain-containing protein n=1 Tax=Solanum lycopersicum TaxID=4081 RepID=A0A3Q7GQI3_SOLLC